ncbi:hypothetical protein [Salicibibacter kimchii]|uniref:Uncharacterized protein n=1 Tax=Salicibibacter kimchii TaxID=2099786 RepID=A0A345BYJ2_9BACI|nr:hypothetical protein [Salicibibacter kimchii]AXF56023.1 hypothetical protein DT065_08285 [Salicibibacter kimchii]
MHGLTVTPKRRDGHEPIMKMQCGPIRYKAKANTHHFDHVLIPKNTPFRQVNENQLFRELSQNEHRNEMILNDVIEALERERSPVILTERLDHVAVLEEKFWGITKHLVVLTGALTKAEMKERIDGIRQISSHEERLIIATGQYTGKGLKMRDWTRFF